MPGPCAAHILRLPSAAARRGAPRTPGPTTRAPSVRGIRCASSRLRSGTGPGPSRCRPAAVQQGDATVRVARRALRRPADAPAGSSGAFISLVVAGCAAGRPATAEVRVPQAGAPDPIAAAAGLGPELARLTGAVDRLATGDMKAAHRPGVAVVVQPGGTIPKRGYGVADVTTGRRVDPDSTLFRIGAITKGARRRARVGGRASAHASRRVRRLDAVLPAHRGPVVGPQGVRDHLGSEAAAAARGRAFRHRRAPRAGIARPTRLTSRRQSRHSQLTAGR